MRYRDTLRATCGTRGIHDVGHVVGAERGFEVPVIGGQEVGPTEVGRRGLGARLRAHHGSDSCPHFVRHVAAQCDGGSGVGEDPADFDRTQAGEQGHRHATGLVNAEIGDEPLQRLVVADQQAHPVTGLEAPFLQTAGKTVGAAMPRSQGELRSIGEVPPRHAFGEGPGQLGDQFWLEQGHASTAGRSISTVRLPRGWCGDCPPAWC